MYSSIIVTVIIMHWYMNLNNLKSVRKPKSSVEMHHTHT